MLVPVPGEIEKSRVSNGIAALPKSRRRLVKAIDGNAAVLRRVRSYLDPLRAQAKKWPESSFVDSSEGLLYHLALASKYGASSSGTSLHVVQSFLGMIDPQVFKDEAAFRLSEISLLATRYEPYMVDEVSLIGHIGQPGIREVIWDALDSAEFGDIVAATGYLGLLRRPIPGIRMLGKSVRKLVSRKEFKLAMQGLATITNLATLPGVTGPIERLAGSLERGSRFSPLVFEIPISLEYDVSTMALREFHPKASPPKGALLMLEYYRAGRREGVWLNQGEESKLRPDPKKFLTSYQRGARKARLSRSRRRLRG